ncbi:MAG: hypothetical protein NTZ59_01760 [Bacteroidetes bacterium]|nr:hypothetical protein [Bacteroidota bacterium]
MPGKKTDIYPILRHYFAFRTQKTAFRPKKLVDSLGCFSFDAKYFLDKSNILCQAIKNTMEQIRNVKNWQWIAWGILAVSIIIKAYYYNKIKYNKSFVEFLKDYFNWAPIVVIKNFGADKYRRQYMRVNNKCMVTLWLMLLLQLLLLFVEEKAKS